MKRIKKIGLTATIIGIILSLASFLLYLYNTFAWSVPLLFWSGTVFLITGMVFNIISRYREGGWEMVTVPIIITAILVCIPLLSQMTSSLSALSATQTQTGSDIVEWRETEVEVTSNDEIKVNLFLENQGADMADSWLVELQPRRTQTLSSLTAQDTCNVNVPWNVHRFFKLDAGEKITFSLTSEPFPGSYDVYLVSTDKCCVDEHGNPYTGADACDVKGLYGWGTYLETVTVPETCTCHSDVDCNPTYDGCRNKKKYYVGGKCDCTCKGETTEPVECCVDVDCPGGEVCSNFNCIVEGDVCYGY